jgi:hypothetical protein
MANHEKFEAVSTMGFTTRDTMRTLNTLTTVKNARNPFVSFRAAGVEKKNATHPSADAKTRESKGQ